MSLAADADRMTQADMDAAATADLIPTGTYEGQVVDFKAKDVDKESSPYYGTAMYRVTAELFDVQGKSRKHFFNVSDRRRVTDGGSLMGPSKLFGQLVTSLAKGGLVAAGVVPPAEQALEAAKQARLKFRVRLAPAKGDYEASNWTDAITVG